MLGIRTTSKTVIACALAALTLSVGAGSLSTTTASAESIQQLTGQMPAGLPDPQAATTALLDIEQRSRGSIDVFLIDPNGGRTSKNIALNFNGQGSIGLLRVLELNQANPTLLNDFAAATKALAGSAAGDTDNLSAKSIWHQEYHDQFPHFDALEQFFATAKARRDLQHRSALLTHVLDGTDTTDAVQALGLNPDDVQLAGFNLGQAAVAGNETPADILRGLDAGQRLQIIRVARALAKYGNNPAHLSNRKNNYESIKKGRLRIEANYRTGLAGAQQMNIRGRFPVALSEYEKERLYDIWVETIGVKNSNNGAQLTREQLKTQASQLALDLIPSKGLMSPLEFIPVYYFVLAELDELVEHSKTGHAEAIDELTQEFEELGRRFEAAVAATQHPRSGAIPVNGESAADIIAAARPDAANAHAHRLSFAYGPDLMYHTAKHYSEMPADHRVRETGTVDDRTNEYLGRTREVITNGNLLSEVRSQDGRGKFLTFDLAYPAAAGPKFNNKCKRVVVRVDQTANGFEAQIMTMMPKFGMPKQQPAAVMQPVKNAAKKNPKKGTQGGKAVPAKVNK